MAASSPFIIVPASLDTMSLKPAPETLSWSGRDRPPDGLASGCKKNSVPSIGVGAPNLLTCSRYWR